MKLLDILQIQKSWIPRENQAAVNFFSHSCEMAGCPTRPDELETFLDETIEISRKRGLEYPKVFLLRLKQLQRGEWEPEPEMPEYEEES